MDSYSLAIEDRSKNLLSAAIATDGQWRFPEQHSVPEKFEQAITLYEDKRFNHHFGVDIISLGRAIKQNVQAGKIVSGGSTITMQTIRLARHNKPRTLFQKMIEIILATRLEFRFSKKEILSLYASHAPFGGNVVGIEAACWRYFGRRPDELSWAEASLLAVLPNNPSLIHLSKNREKLKAKRDGLLDRLASQQKIDVLTLQLAKDEPLPQAPLALPNHAPHLLQFAAKKNRDQQKISSTIDGALQQRVAEIVNQHYLRLSGNKIFNAAVLVADVNTGEVLAYVGNTSSGKQNHEQVDVVQAPRSSGSVLKPFLYAALMDEGKILPHSLQPDIPTYINGFAPENFSHELDGAVPASEALIRSLNIPAVHELKTFRYERFYELLKRVGISTLNKPADHYGLSLILGGAEVTLWDVTSAYASLARTLNHYFDFPGKNRYRRSDFHPLTFIKMDSATDDEPEASGVIGAGATYLTFQTLKELYRPGEESGWRLFNSSNEIAWKTGTSHGFRDAWAVGVNPNYVIGVWVGNADGEGRPGLTGIEAAAPLLFEVQSLLPKTNWFSSPTLELVQIPVCANSGYRMGEWCPKADTIQIVAAGLASAACPMHQRIHLSADRRFRVHSGCEDPSKMTQVSWFLLPPVQEYYYKRKHSSYQTLPPLRADCYNFSNAVQMDIVYPEEGSKIFIPKELGGNPGKIILQAVAHHDKAVLYWHIDGVFKKTTEIDHKWAIFLEEGDHRVTVMDENGVVLQRNFRVISK